MLIQINQGARIAFFLSDATDNETGETNITIGDITCEISRNGQSFQTCTGVPAEVDHGWYVVDLTAAETNNVGNLIFRATVSGGVANVWNDVHQVVEHLMSDDDVARVADVILRRSMANVEASSHGDTQGLPSLHGLIMQSFNSAVSGTTVTVTKTDDVTTLGTYTITIDGNGEWAGKSL